MRKRTKLALLVTLCVVWWQPAVAAGGFVISPAFQQVEVPADQSEASYDLALTNRTTVDQNFALSMVDFGALDEEGGVAFLGTPTSELEHKYGLAAWVILEKNKVFIPAGGKAIITLKIVNRASLAPGGHYGAVLATAVTDTGEPMRNAVGVKQVLASLVLAIKEGGAERNLQLVSQSTNAAFWHLPTSVGQRYQNLGNVQVTPRGVVAVEDPTGREVARSAINEGSGMILPESFRRYSTNLLRVAPAWMPGRYRVVSTYRYDGTDRLKTFSTTFWYAGMLVVWVVGLLTLGAMGFLVWWLWLRPRRRSQAR